MFNKNSEQELFRTTRFRGLIVRKWDSWLRGNHFDADRLSIDGFYKELRNYFEFQEKYLDIFMNLSSVKIRLDKTINNPETSFWLRKRGSSPLNNYLLLGDVLLTCPACIYRTYIRVLWDMGRRSSFFWRRPLCTKPVTKTKVLLATNWPMRDVFKSKKARKILKSIRQKLTERKSMKQILSGGEGPLCKSFEVSHSLPAEAFFNFF